MALSSKLLSTPLDEADAQIQSFLADLQGNILKGHGRDLTANVFLRFDPAQSSGTRAFLAKLASQVTSAKTQLQQVDAFKKEGRSGGLVTFVFLAKAGYDALGLGDRAPGGAAFAAGMAGRSGLNDPEEANWEAHLLRPHALVLLGDDSAKGLDIGLARLCEAARKAKIAISGIERGQARFNSHGNGIEHFGYVDGRSQPLLLKRDVEAESEDPNGGTSRWDPAFSPIDTVLVPEPKRTPKDPERFGSYFVFRKLEQDVKRFKDHEQDLAIALQLKKQGDPDTEAAELAGALAVGRFEDGTPVALSHLSTSNGGVPNDFDYEHDAGGVLCPFQAHIRKVNPRSDLSPNDARIRIMARRGIPYGVRQDDGEDRAVMPSGGVGLLFMAYQTSIERQFEFTQASWANNENFRRPGTGIDPVIGQQPSTTTPANQTWQVDRCSSKLQFGFSGFVHLKGGEYFFAPSIAFLKSL